ncbi:MAG: hypothetical protein QOK36_3870, partial [Gaiellales bacterium]|nr:hypothetical protein [Gaiellales bacterium]
MSETRETFADLSTAGVVAWYALTAVSTGIFVWGVVALVAKYRRGRRDAAPPEPRGPRLRRAAWIVLTHVWIRRRDGTSGAAHLLVFYGFLVLLAGTTILALQDDIVAPLFGVHFWRGWFYLAYSLALDLGGLALVVGLLMFGWKRYAVRPDRLRYRSDMGHYARGDAVFLGGLF